VCEKFYDIEKIEPGKNIHQL